MNDKLANSHTKNGEHLWLKQFQKTE